MLTLLASLEHFLPLWLGVPPRVPEYSSTLSLRGAPYAVILALFILGNTTFNPLAVAFLLLGLHRLLRSKWLAAAVLVLILGLVIAGEGEGSGAHNQISIPLACLQIGLWILVVLRFGVLSLVAVAFVSVLLDSVPITADFSHWYAASGAVGLVVTLALALYGFAHAL